MAGFMVPVFNRRCPACGKRDLPGASKEHPFGDLLCDHCAATTNKALAQRVNVRLTRRKLDTLIEETIR